jgi:hypothetical protein
MLALNIQKRIKTHMLLLLYLILSYIFFAFQKCEFYGLKMLMKHISFYINIALYLQIYTEQQ